MFASFLITFRETLEAALVVGIVMGFLSRTGQKRLNSAVHLGIGAGISLSLLGAWLFNRLAGGFEGRAEEIFEGLTMLVGAGLLTTMILWMMKHKPSTAQIEGKIAAYSPSGQRLAIFLLVFVSILREGIETVVFLGAARFIADDQSLAAALMGIVCAIALGVGIFYGSLRVSLKHFFLATTILLILFAAGLTAHGFHELQEAGVMPTLIAQVWDINPSLNDDGSSPLLHEKGAFGAILKGLFGYNGNPSLLEIICWLVYLGAVSFVWRLMARLKRKLPESRQRLH